MNENKKTEGLYDNYSKNKMKMNITYQPELNSITKRLPKHLHRFIVKQPYEEYTAQNQAVWRYVMRLNIDYLNNTAHSYYVDGLKKQEYR